jgi:hypothetical protein
MILQLRHIFLTEAATFMVFSLTFSLGAEHDPRATQTDFTQMQHRNDLRRTYFASE